MTKSCECGCGTEVRSRFARGHNGGMRGKTHTAETRARMSSAHIGNRHDEVSKQKISDSNRRRAPLQWSTASRALLSEALRQRYASQGGRHRPETIERMKEARARRVIPFRDTKPERQVQGILSGLDVAHRTHVPIPGLGRHQWDVVVDSAHLLIEVDGCYWHGCDACGYGSRSHAPRARVRDAELTATALAAGWRILRIPEHDLGTAAELILPALTLSASVAA